MPSCHVKQKCFEKRGEVVSYTKNPSVFYYRERVKETGSYRSQKIEGASTLEEALARHTRSLPAFVKLMLVMFQSIGAIAKKTKWLGFNRRLSVLLASVTLVAR